jgi:hypothetical protein
VFPGVVIADARYSLTVTFLHSAALFARRATEIEASTTAETLTGDLLDEHHGCVLAAVMQSVAALESEIHEVIVHGPSHHLGSSDFNAIGRDALRPLTKRDRRKGRNRALKRYARALILLGVERPRTFALWRDAVFLVKYRNELTHYKSKWGENIDNKFIARLIRLKLPRARFISKDENRFPRTYLSAAYATWAVRRSLAFLREFFARLGAKSPVTHLESKITFLLTPPPLH